MPVLQIEHGITDYAAWRAAFDRDPIGRERGGVRSFRVLRPVDDAHRITIELDFATRGEAEAFRAKLRAFWSSAAPQRVLVGEPAAEILDDVTAV